jgi:hypothetical protein
MKLIVTTLVVLFGFTTTPSATADSANPPKIISIKQTTAGPYKPGDLIQFAIGTQGGFPGIKNVSIFSECILGQVASLPAENDAANSGVWIFSGDVSPKCQNGFYKIQSVTIKDKTELVSTSDGTGLISKDSDLNFEIVHKIIEPLPGEVRKPLIPDSIPLPKLPTSYPGKKISILLPRFSVSGQFIRWGLQIGGKDTCAIKSVFQSNFSASLEITNRGTCIFFAQPMPLSQVYSVPILKSNWAPYGSANMASFIKMVIK